jgi:hypothetical protein
MKRWIDEGAHAPEETPAADPRDHWAYKPPVRPAVPTVQHQVWVSNPIDAFLAADLEKAGLAPSPPADKGVLLRRVHFDLTGLPPTRDQLRAFLADASPDAYERVVDQLLASPQYGERWGRHWMDVWRYSDWSGYRDEIRNSARHIWRWRDWIVESLNADKGYDRMVVEMLAGDEQAPEDADVLRATGFLARHWFKFNRNTWLDGVVEHTAKAFLGVTMNCARCHDHKYDPISQEDYYRFRAIFEPYDVRTDRVPGQADVAQDGLPRVFDAKPEEPTYLFTRGNEKQPDKERPMAPGVPEALGPPIEAQPIQLSAKARYPALRQFVIEEELAKAAATLGEREAARTTAQAAVATGQKKLNDLVANGSDPSAAQQEWLHAVAGAELADKQLATARAADASLKARIAAEKAKYGLSPGGDNEALALAASKAERELALCTAQEQQATATQEMARANAAAKPDEAASQAAVATATEKLNSAKTAIAAAHAALATPSDKYQPLGEALPATSTGRRLALARWITSRENSLAARVTVNHIWLRHFGSPLVDSMFDFGLRSPTARHQPLLDWLAVELMDHGWSMKHLHRLIVTSNAYRMKSSAGETGSANGAIDPDNRLLWRMNAHRLEAEVVRDAMFFVAGRLDLKQGGPDIDYNLLSPTARRSIYLRHAYEKQAKFLELFDGPSVNECYRRSESIVPQQALALANSDVSLEQSRHLAAQLSMASASGPATEEAFVTQAFEQMLGREPSSAEANECLQFLTAQTEKLKSADKLTPFAGGAKAAVEASADPAQRARENLVHVLYNHNEFVTVR